MLKNGTVAPNMSMFREWLNISNTSAAGVSDALLGWWPHPLAPHPLAPHPWAPHLWAPHPWAPHPWSPHPWHLWAAANQSEMLKNGTVAPNMSMFQQWLNISNTSAAGDSDPLLGFGFGFGFHPLAP